MDVSINAPSTFGLSITIFPTNFLRFTFYSLANLASDLRYVNHWKYKQRFPQFYCTATKHCKNFLSCYLANHDHLWAIIKGTASLNQFLSVALLIFEWKVPGSLVTRLGPKARPGSYLGLNMKPRDLITPLDTLPTR